MRIQFLRVTLTANYPQLYYGQQLHLYRPTDTNLCGFLNQYSLPSHEGSYLVHIA